MKLYKIITVGKKVTITHSEKGVKYKKPRTRLEYTTKDVLVENPASLISSSLTRGHLEESLERIADYLAALTVGNKITMANCLDTEHNWQESLQGYKFED